MAAKKSRKFSSLVIYSHLQRLKGMQGRFPKVKTGRSDHGWANHLDKEILLKNHLLFRAYHLGFD